MNNKVIKEKILTSIERAREQGYTLVSEEWGSQDTKCACALGCVLVANDKAAILDDYGSQDVETARILEVTETWINSFIDGYDDNGTDGGAADPEAWLLGHEIRVESNPISFIDFVDHMDE